MEDESPIMKAMREFAMADPEDCDREWAAYLALVSGKDMASPPSSTNSATPLHHRAPAAAVATPATTRSTTPLHAQSGITSATSASTVSTSTPAAAASASTSARLSKPATKDDLSPEAHRISGVLKDATSSTSISEESASRWNQDDVYPPLAELRRALMTDAEWAAMSEWEKDLWEMKHLPEEERMKSIEGIVMWLPAAQQEQRRTELLEEVLRFGEPASTLDPSTAPTSTTPNTTTMLQVAVELDNVHGDDKAATTPTTCSAECPSHNASVYVAALFLSATPTLSRTTGGIVPELAAPELNNKALDFNDTDQLATHKLIGVVSLHTGIKRQTWTPPRYVTFQEDNMCNDMPQAWLLNGFVLERTHLMLWAAKNPWPPPPSDRSIS